MFKKLLMAALWMLAISCLPAHAQSPLRILVGFPPGGTSDSVARLYAESLGKSLNRTVVVENKPGAGGAIAAMALKSSPADGSTVMLAAIVNISIYPSTTTPSQYDPFKDFKAIAMVGQYDLALAVNEASGVRTVTEYVQWIKTHPAQANFGSPGNGSLPHLFGAQLAQVTGTDLVHVPFQGAAPSVVNLLSGQIGAVIQPVGDLLAQHAAGKLRILASTGLERNAQIPGVPTFRELGYPTLTGSGWIGLFARAGGPDAANHAIWQATQSAQATPAIKARMQALGFDNPVAMRSEEFLALAQRDATKWGEVVKTSGLLAKTP